MVGRFFSSSAGSNASVSSKMSRKERLEQAKQAAAAEKSRRRNFGFLNSGDKRMSSKSISRTREHAKQLAMAYDEPETPTSMFSQQPMIGFNDDAPFDPFGTLTTTKSAPKSTLQQSRNAGSFLDQHFERETASTQDSFDTASVGSAYDMDFLPSTSSRNQHTTPKKTKKRSQKTTLDQFVESDLTSPYSSSGSLGLESRSRNGERSVISMPTFPTNSSMQSSFARQNSSTSSSGAAARRRMRSQMRQHSSNSSVCSASSETSSFCSTPPESPASSVRNMSKNRVAAYQRTGTGSFYSQNSSTNSNSGNSGSDNLFDTDNNNGGFTFDAFGLDQSQVERDVDRAMQDLAGQGISGFSMFLNTEIEEDFAPENWDSPVGSRQASPAPLEGDGFVDGFRVSRQNESQSSLPEHSPAASERSMSSAASRRLMRSQAKSTPPRWGGQTNDVQHQHQHHPQPEPTIFDEPVNPWKEDPWGSDPEDRDFSSDVGADSDFAGAKSDVIQSSFQPVQRYSDSQSDGGAQSNQFQKSVSFHANVRLPHDQFPDENDDDGSQLQEHVAQEFAEAFAKKVSPRSSQGVDARPAVDYGYGSGDYGPARNNGVQYDQNDTGHANQATSVPREPADFQAENQFAVFGDDHEYAAQEQAFEHNFGAFGAASAEERGVPGSGAHSKANYFEDQNAHNHFGEASQPAPVSLPQEEQDLHSRGSIPTQRFNQNQASPREQTTANISTPSPEHVVGDYGPVRSNFRARNAAKEVVAETPGKSKIASFRSKYEQSREPIRPPLADEARHDYGPVKSTPASYRAPYSGSGQAYNGEQHGTYHPQPHEDSSIARQSVSTLRDSYTAAKTRVGSAQHDHSNDFETNRNQLNSHRAMPFKQRHAAGADMYEADSVKENHSEDISGLNEAGLDFGGTGHLMPTEAFEGPEQSEEKKEDEESPSEQKNTGSIGSLKAKWRKWEAQSSGATFTKETLHDSAKARNENRRESTVAEIGNSLGVEILTPDIVEARRQEKRRIRTEELKKTSQEPIPSPKNLRKVPEKQISASEERLNECVDQRNSFASLRERLKPPTAREEGKAKSETGIGYRNGLAATVVERLQKESPTSRSVDSGFNFRDTQSDTGTTPSFLANVKLRKTTPKRLEEEPVHDPSDEHRSPSDAVHDVRTSEQKGGPPPRSNAVRSPEPEVAEKKLTYRERRELELKRQQEEKSKLEALKGKEPPKKDVAALIRRRIAANKQKSSVNNQGDEAESQPVSDVRDRLKPVARDLSAQSSASASSPRIDQSRLHPASPRFSNSKPANELPQIDSNPSLRSPLTSPRNDVSNHSKRFSSPREHRLSSEENLQLSTDLYPVEPGDQMLHNVLSPSSVGTDMEYSTDNSHSVASNVGSHPTQKKLDESISAREYQAENAISSPRKFGNAASVTSPRNVSSPQKLKEAKAENSLHSSPELKKPVLPTTGAQAADPAAKETPTKNSDVKAMLSNFLGGRPNMSSSLPAPTKEDDVQALLRSKNQTEKVASPEKAEVEREPTPPPPPPPASVNTGGRPALKDDPKYERYFRMLKVGMPMEVVKHAMQKDGNDPSVMDGDHNKPVGLPLKEDPKYAKYFKMLKLGVSINQVKHSMQMDGLMPEVMDQDHNLPAISCEQRSKKEPKEKPTHRRARLHWKTHQKVQRNSVWAKLEQEHGINDIDIDEDEFNELFQADLKPTLQSPSAALGANRKKGAAVRVIDAKRANNGGIILARVKMTHDEMADAVDRIDGDALSTEQIENIIEFLPTKEEREQLEKYMLEGDEDAAEKFDGLCECEKFMVSMMTVKHAKRKVRALLFKLQFYSCLESIAEDARVVDSACEELRNSNRLRQLLGIVLQFGNRLNTAGATTKRKAGAFSLDSLLKLNQAKAFDKKTTFLHYIVLIVQRNNDLLLNFVDDLPTVTKADKIYWDQCLSDLEEVENQLENVRRISLHEARSKKMQGSHDPRNGGSDDDSLGDMDMTLEEEVEALRSTRTGLFTLSAIKQVSALRDQVEVTGRKFMKLLTYFGEDEKKMQPHELFNIFSVFCRDFGKAKEEVFANVKKRLREERKKTRTPNTSGKNGKPPTGLERPSKPLRVSSHQPNMSKVLKDFQNSAGDQPQPPQKHNAPDKTRKASNANDSNAGRYPTKSAPMPPNPAVAHKATNGVRAHQRQGVEPVRRYAPRPDVPEEPVPQGMQESGRFEELSAPDSMDSTYQVSSAPPPRTGFGQDNLRQNTRRQMQIVSGRATPVASNTSIKSQQTTARANDHMPYGERVRNQARPPPSYMNTNSVPPRSSQQSSRHMMRHRRRMEAQRQSSAQSNAAPTNVAAN